MSKIWDQSVDVKGNRLVVLLALADWANDDGFCWPSKKLISEKCRLSKQGAIDVVVWLEDAGYLTVQTGGGKGNRSHYSIHPTPIAKGQVTLPNEDPERVKLLDPNETPKGSSCDSKGSSWNHSKGQVDTSHIYRFAYGEPPIEPSIEPSVCTHAQEIPPTKSSPFSTALFSAVLEISDTKKRDWEMHRISSNARFVAAKLIAKLEDDKRTVEDVKAVGEKWPAYLGKDPTETDPPRFNQLLDHFDRVLKFDPESRNRKNHDNPKQPEHKSITNLKASLIYE